MDKKVLFIGITLVLILSLAGVAFYFSDRDTGSATTLITPTITPAQMNNDQNAPDLQITPTIPPDWKSYSNQQLLFTMRHPEGVSVQETQSGAITFIQLGPTQSQGTELFDGFNVTIEKGIIQQGDFIELVANVHDDAEDDPITVEVSTVQRAIVGGVDGYTFTQTGLGEFTHYYLPKGTNEYFHISVIVADPGDFGFQQTVDIMLSSFNF